MDFIIWGSGYRGRHVCQFIGEKRTAAFIDQDIKKQGKKLSLLFLFKMVLQDY